jgi:DNA-binding beta-propeller fold protein YncE
VYGAQTPGNQVAVIDIASAKVTKTIDLGEYTRPHSAAFLPDGKTVVVTSETRQAVVVIDLENGEVSGAIPTGNPGSHMLAMPRDKKRIYTANIGNGTVSELDIASRSLMRSFPVATRTEGIGVAPDGSTAWVGSNDGKTITVVDIASGTFVTRFDGFGFPYRIGFSSDGAIAVVTDPNNDEVRVYDAPGRKELGRISIGAGTGPVGVNFAPDSRIAYISLNGGNGIAEIDVTALKVVRRFSTEIRPDGVVYVKR